MGAVVEEARIFEDSGVTLMARVVGENAVNITQSAISTIDCKIFDRNDPGTVINSESLTVADVVFNTLQTDARWTKDTTGYNFRHSPSAAHFSSGNRVYRVEYKFTPTTGNAFHIAYDLETLNLLGS